MLKEVQEDMRNTKKMIYGQNRIINKETQNLKII
jgi:hypothetical protein